MAYTVETQASEVEEVKLRSVREKCINRIKRAVTSSSKILTEADIRAYVDDVISDKAFAISGITDTKKKIQLIEENISVHIPKLESESKALAQKFEEKIMEAQKNGWISEQSAKRWIVNRLGGNSALYWHKKKFIELDLAKFPTYFANWKRVAEEAKELRKHPHIKQLTSADVSQISAFINPKQFLNLSFEARESLLSHVHAALLAKEKRMPELYKKAKAMLEGAAKSQALSWNKVGTWLQRIFKSGAKPEQIEQFLNNQGSMPLQKLIDNWSEASQNFHQLQAKRKALGSPQSFQFVKMNVFLNWGYEQRKAYLREAEYRFTDIDKEPGLFLKIRHELDVKDWDAAEELIGKARRGENQWGEVNEKKLQSMENFLKRHRETEGGPDGAEKKSNPREVVQEMQQLLSGMPAALRHMYEEALSDGYQAFWSFTVLMYNRVWCHQHGFYDEAKEQVMEKESKDPTRKRMHEGHSHHEHEVNNITGSTADKHAVRDQTGINKAQIMFVDPNDSESKQSVHERNRQQCNNRCWWYWTSVIPKGVTYSEHLYIVQNIHPKLKKLAKQLEGMGMRYGQSVGGEGASLMDGKRKTGAPSLH